MDGKNTMTDTFSDDCLTFRVTGRVKPYVRMTRRGKFTDPQAQEYLASKAAIGYQLKEQMAAADLKMLPAQTPLAVDISVYYKSRMHAHDLDNIIKALLDAMQGIVYQNDCWIDYISALRLAGKVDETIITIREIR
jgi:Holliday junction resolvase RusA-like endonuclease